MVVLRPSLNGKLYFFSTLTLSLKYGVDASIISTDGNTKYDVINDQYFEDLLRGYGLPSGADEIQEEYLSSAQCGSVNIGNNYATNQISGEITVIIVGDILNVGNTCGG